MYTQIDDLKHANLIIDHLENDNKNGKSKAYYIITEKGQEILSKMQDISDLT